MRIGVVVPARNEAGRIGLCLASLAPFRWAGDRIFVVDDGSDDGTVDEAREAGAEVLAADRPGRGFAVAAGVAEASPGADVVLVAHADMVFPAEARPAIARTMHEHPGAPGGFLGHRIDAPGWRFRLLEGGNRIRAAALGLAYGDQGVFLRVAVLRTIGGFPAQSRLEDLELALRLRDVAPVVDARCPVRIPPRHWAEGTLRVTLRNWATVVRYAHARGARNAR